MLISIKSKILSVVALSLCGMAVCVFSLSWRSYHKSEQGIHNQLESIVQASNTIIQSEYDLFQDGLITEAVAKENALRSIAALRYGGSEYVFILDEDVNMLMHPIKPKLNNTSVKNSQDPTGKFLFREMVEVAMNGGGIVEYMWPRPGDEEPVQKASYLDVFEPWGFVIGTGVYIDDLKSVLMNTLIEGFIILLAFGGITGLVAMRTANSVVRPMLRLADTMKELTLGNTSIAVEGTERKDEIGPMAVAVTAFRDGLAERAVLEKANKEAESSNLLRQNKIEKLIEVFKGKSADVLSQMEANIHSLKSSSDGLQGYAQETDAQSARASAVSHETSSNVQTVAAAAEELSASVSEIMQNVHNNNGTISETANMTSKANEKVKELANAVSKISDVVSLIADIAEQTNLLALNATIEAARAGDSGKGFAVVASEVKQLADQTARATDEISNQISMVQGSTKETVVSIENITQSMEEVSNIMSAIAAAVEEQGAATNEISRNAQFAATGTLEVSENTQNVTKTAKDTTSSALEVGHAADDLAMRAEEMKVQVEQFLSGVAAA